MLVQNGHPPIDAGGVVAELDRAVQHHGRAVVVVVDAYQHLPRRHVGIFHPLLGSVDRADRHHVAQGGHHLSGGAGRGPATDGFLDHVSVADSAPVGAGALVGDQITTPDQIAQQSPMRFGGSGDHTMAVGSGEHVVGADAVYRVAHRPHRATHVGIHHLAGLRHGHHGVDHGHIEKLAYTGVAGSMHRRQQSEGSHQPRYGVPDGGPDLHHVGLVGAGGGHHPAHGLGDEVICGPLRIGAGRHPGVPEAADGGVDQLGIALVADLPAHPEPVQNAAA